MSTATIQMPSRGRGTNPASPDARWLKGRFVVIATAVSAMGVSNISRFPDLVSRSGGGAFVLAYLGALVGLAFPIMMAELVVGRRGRQTCALCFEIVAQDEGHSFRWGITGVLASGAGLLILAAYAEAAGSTATLLTGLGLNAGIGAEVGWQGIFLGCAALIGGRGLSTGLRPLNTRLLPVTLSLLLGLLAYSAASTPELRRAVLLVFQPDFTRLTWSGVLDAGRLALLTVGVGLGVMVSYGASITDSTSILRTSALSLVSTASLVLIAAVVALAIPPTQVWDGFLVLTGLGGTVAILHPLIEQLSNRTGLPRGQATLLVSGLGWVVAALIHIAEGSFPVGWLHLGIDLLMPGAALCVVLFVGWAMSRRSSRMELGLRSARLFVVWRWLIRVALPPLLAGMLLLGLLARLH